MAARTRPPHTPGRAPRPAPPRAEPPPARVLPRRRTRPKPKPNRAAPRAQRLSGQTPSPLSSPPEGQQLREVAHKPRPLAHKVNACAPSSPPALPPHDHPQRSAPPPAAPRGSARRRVSRAHGGARRAGCRAAPPPSRTRWTRRVPHPVLIGHAAQAAARRRGGLGHVRLVDACLSPTKKALPRPAQARRRAPQRARGSLTRTRTRLDL